MQRAGREAGTLRWTRQEQERTAVSKAQHMQHGTEARVARWPRRTNALCGGGSSGDGGSGATVAGIGAEG